MSTIPMPFEDELFAYLWGFAVRAELFRIRVKICSLFRIAIPWTLYSSRVLAAAIANCEPSDELIESDPFVMVKKDQQFHVIFMVRSPCLRNHLFDWLPIITIRIPKYESLSRWILGSVCLSDGASLKKPCVDSLSPFSITLVRVLWRV